VKTILKFRKLFQKIGVFSFYKLNSGSMVECIGLEANFKISIVFEVKTVVKDNIKCVE